VECPGALDHNGVLEHDVTTDELAEIADPVAEKHRYLADAELIDEAQVEGLLDDVGTGSCQYDARDAVDSSVSHTTRMTRSPSTHGSARNSRRIASVRSG
jgi:hypothetical protein